MRLGYACISLPMREKEIYSTRTLTIKSLCLRGNEEIKRLALLNIEDLKKILEDNERRGIRFFRVTSNLIPHLGNPRAECKGEKKYTEQDWPSCCSIEFAREKLAEVGSLARRLGHRLTMHPGQYTQLSSLTSSVVDQSIIDLNIHATILSLMGLTPEMGSVMIIHGGGVFENREETLRRLEKNIERLSKDTRKYLCLENDERWSIPELLPLCQKLDIPLCVDFFHHSINSGDFVIDDDTIQPILRTWYRRGIKPKAHYSEQAEGQKEGAHSKLIKGLSRGLLSFCNKYDIDLMLEAKDKDVNVELIHAQFFTPTYVQGRLYWELS